jgi:hypothetical protein
MRKPVSTPGSTSPARRARTAFADSSGDKSTPRHCASTRWRAEAFPGPRGGIRFCGCIKKFWTENLKLETKKLWRPGRAPQILENERVRLSAESRYTI